MTHGPLLWYTEVHTGIGCSSPISDMIKIANNSTIPLGETTEISIHCMVQTIQLILNIFVADFYIASMPVIRKFVMLMSINFDYIIS